MPNLFSNFLTKKVSDPHTKYQMTQRTISVWLGEFSRQEYWNGLPCPSPGDLPNPGVEPRSPTMQADSLLSEPPGKPIIKALLEILGTSEITSVRMDSVTNSPHISVSFTLQLCRPRVSWGSVSSLTCSQRNHQSPGHREKQIWRIIQ